MRKLFLILCLACLPAAAAAAPTSDLAETPADMIDLTKGPYMAGDVTITLAGDTSPVMSSKATYSIVQGQTRSHRIYRPASHVIDLNWGNPSNSLKLTVVTPSGQQIGSLYDNSDGLTDGRIRMNVNANPGIWKYIVIGHNVTGTQNYSIS